MDIVNKIEQFKKTLDEAENNFSIQWDTTAYENSYHEKPEKRKEPTMWQFEVEFESGHCEREPRLSDYMTYEKAKSEITKQLKSEYTIPLIVYVDAVMG